jgi:hypothetical protein
MAAVDLCTFNHGLGIYIFYLIVDDRAHQTRRSGQNSHPISTEIALPRLQSEIQVAWFLFESH